MTIYDYKKTSDMLKSRYSERLPSLYYPPLISLALTACVPPGTADDVASTLVAPYRADLMVCATLAQSEEDGQRCIEQVRESWEPILGADE